MPPIERNVDAPIDNEVDQTLPQIFSLHDGYDTTVGQERYLNDKEFQHAHMYVLSNSNILEDHER